MKNYLIILIGLIFFTSCEEEITISIPEPDYRIVVEGYIENGSPPYVMLTSNSAYFSEVDISDFEESFVHNAIVRIHNGVDTIILEEYCFNELDSNQKAAAQALFGVTDGGNDTLNICIYAPAAVDLIQGKMFGVEDTRYFLEVEGDTSFLSAQTMIPGVTPLYDFFWTDHPNEDSTDLKVLNFTYSDPDTIGNFARYWTSTNNDPYYPGYFTSVFDDGFINGETFSGPLDRAQSRQEEFNQDLYGYWRSGDTVLVKWASINKDQYQFWRTVEQEVNNTGNPFAQPTIILSNIKGGAHGIWGGVGAFYSDTLYAP